jgi:hypothetical protein
MVLAIDGLLVAYAPDLGALTALTVGATLLQ